MVRSSLATPFSSHTPQDFGHRKFWEGLVQHRNELEQLLHRLEGRGYDLLLEAQNAAWVRSQSSHESVSGCSKHHGDFELGLDDTSDLFSSDPLERSVFAQSESARLWEGVRWRLSCFMLPTSSIFYEERKRVVWAYFRRAIYTDPTLMILASNHVDVPTFLTDPNHDVAIAKLVQEKMRRMSTEEIWAAIADVLRPVDTETEFIVVLGMRVYKSLSGIAHPFRAWGHVFAFRSCVSCVRTICPTVEDMIECQRYALLTGSANFPVPHSTHVEHANFYGVGILAVCGLLVGFVETEKHVTGPTHSKSEDGSGDITWEQKKHPPVLYAALSCEDEYSHRFLNELLRRCLLYKHLTVILRKGKDQQVVRSMHCIHATYRRTSSSLVGLTKGSRWECTTTYKDAILESCQAEIFCHGSSDAMNAPAASFDDCMQFVLLDGINGDHDECYILRDLIRQCMTQYNVKTPVDLCKAIAEPYVAQGELELDEMVCEGSTGNPNLEYGFVAYEALWGAPPRWQEERQKAVYRSAWSMARLLAEKHGDSLSSDLTG
ncbi:hypothetical protein R3P38DRAFT_2516426 [Favolaschia claudopus]|uniref:Uncharacterized protein n=1 Tax=Favolaschia claudopus TaxID=2862362 RepID=A0AAW0CI13_9AGAR